VPTLISPAGQPGAEPRAAADLGLPAVLCVQQRDSEEIRRVLAAFQAPVRECVDGRGAIAAARSFPLFCAIVPLQMPDMGASALIGSLHAAAPGLAVLVVVDSPAVSEAVAVMRSGAHAVIDSRILSTGLMVHLAPLLRGR
jgi:DNA-binding NarL/FixJ family response regulator